MNRIHQFAYNTMPVPEGLTAIDCRRIRNPYKILDPVAQRQAVRSDPFFNQLVDRGVRVLKEKHDISVGCSFGKHRSVIVAEEIYARAIMDGLDVEIVRMGDKVPG